MATGVISSRKWRKSGAAASATTAKIIIEAAAAAAAQTHLWQHGESISIYVMQQANNVSAK